MRQGGVGERRILLVMLIDSMIPEATRDSGRAAGLVTTLGFALATALSSLS
jgi:ZIP family zinc transporter